MQAAASMREGTSFRSLDKVQLLQADGIEHLQAECVKESQLNSIQWLAPFF
jgi:hypothetical protein